MPDESLSHPGERLPNWLARSLSQAFTPRASLADVPPRQNSLSDEECDFATSTSTTTATAAAATAATTTTRRGGAAGLHDAFKPSTSNAISLTASVGGWNNVNLSHQAPLHQLGLDLAFHNLSFRAGGKGARGKDILREASGYALAGRLTAVQGPSGAGKVRFCFFFCLFRQNREGEERCAMRGKLVEKLSTMGPEKEKRKDVSEAFFRWLPSSVDSPFSPSLLFFLINVKVTWRPRMFCLLLRGVLRIESSL